MKLKTALLTTLLTVNVMLGQTNYYVNGLLGNDLNNGLSNDSAWQTIQKACQSATPGSTVHILPGIYHENPEMMVSGAESNPITFIGDANNTVIIDGTGSVAHYLLRIENASYLRFENIVFQNLTGNGSYGILVETNSGLSVTDLSFKNCIIRNIRWTSDPTLQAAPSDNAHGIIVYGRSGGVTNLTIDGCEIYGNDTGYSEALTLAGNVKGFAIKNCSVHDNSNIGIDLSGHRGVSSVDDEVRNGFISNNFCYNNASDHATSAGIYVDGANDIIIERNVSHNNGYGIEIGAEEDGITYSITVRNNILYKNQGGGIEMGGYDPLTNGEVQGCIIRNNSFFGNNTYLDGVGELHITKASNCTIQNNIFYTNEQQTLMSAAEINPQIGNVFNYNCWYTPNSDPNDIVVRWRHVNYTTFDAYQLALSQDINSDYLNPGFEFGTESPNFHLETGSLCVNSGDVSTLVSPDEKDFEGNARVVENVIDKGAFEYTPSLTTIQPLLSTYSLTPNPASATVSLRLKGDAGSGTFRIYDSLGHILLTQAVRLPETIIDVSGFPGGIYFTDMENNGSHKTEKLVIQK